MFLTSLAALLVTIGVMILVLRLLGRMNGVPSRGARRGSLQVLDRVSTGPRQGVVLLRVGSRVLIVGIGEGHTLLGELDEAAKESVMDSVRPSESRAPWRRPPILARFGLMLCLALLPLGLSAQTVTSPKPVPQKSITSPGGGVAAPVVKGPTPPTVDFRVGSGNEELKLSGAVGVVVFMAALTLLPAIFMLMTGFTRILVVLGFLRSAMGTQGAPPTQLLVAIAVILTGVVMQPTMSEVNKTALQPYLHGEIGQKEAYDAAIIPMRAFMLANTRDKDLATFVDLSGQSDAASLNDIPTMTVVSAFITSELRTAFQMGFVIFLPFLVIDLIVASVLMSMGMFMLPPVMVSMPFKLLLFVLADGWSLVMQNLVLSFRHAA